MESGFNSFAGVKLLKCFMMKFDAAFSSLGPIAVPTLNLSLNASLRESDCSRKERKSDSIKFKQMKNKNLASCSDDSSIIFYVKDNN